MTNDERESSSSPAAEDIATMLAELPRTIGNREAKEVSDFSQLVDETKAKVDELAAEETIGAKALSALQKALRALDDARKQVIRRSFNIGRINQISNSIRQEIIEPLEDAVTTMAAENKSLHRVGWNAAKISVGATIIMGMIAIFVAVAFASKTTVIDDSDTNGQSMPQGPQPVGNEDPQRARNRVAEEHLKSLGTPQEDLVLNEISRDAIAAIIENDTSKVYQQEQRLIDYRSDRSAYLTDPKNNEDYAKFLYHYAIASFRLGNWGEVKKSCLPLVDDGFSHYELEKTPYALPLGVVLAQYHLLEGDQAESEKTYEDISERIFPFSTDASALNVPLPHITPDSYTFEMSQPRSFFQERKLAIDQEHERRESAAKMLRSVVVGVYDSRDAYSARLKAVTEVLDGHVRSIITLDAPPDAQIQALEHAWVYRYRDNSFDKKVTKNLVSLLENIAPRMKDQTRYGTDNEDVIRVLKLFKPQVELGDEEAITVNMDGGIARFLIVLN